MVESPAEPPFLRIGPDAPASPLVLSVPHAGRAYSAALLASSRLPRSKLETLEDPLVDRLIWRTMGLGAVALVARAPRAEIDLNRDERELDARLVNPAPPTDALLDSPRTRGGLGLIPARVGASGAIWLKRLPAAEVARRVETIHRPYHDAIEAALAAARARWGAAILLDCHSMPPRHAKEAGVVLGDLHGASMAPHLVEAAMKAVEAAGFKAARNAPYAGGHVTGRHGRPGQNVHALQIEIDRSLYLGPDLRSPGPGFDAVARMLAAIAQALVDRLLDQGEAIAAE